MGQSEYEHVLYSRVFVRMRKHAAYGGYVPECDRCAGTTDKTGGAVMLACWRCGYQASEAQFMELLKAAGSETVDGG